jgi:hypothetical protein
MFLLKNLKIIFKLKCAQPLVVKTTDSGESDSNPFIAGEESLNNTLEYKNTVFMPIQIDTNILPTSTATESTGPSSLLSIAFPTKVVFKDCLNNLGFFNLTCFSN